VELTDNEENLARRKGSLELRKKLFLIVLFATMTTMMVGTGWMCVIQNICVRQRRKSSEQQAMWLTRVVKTQLLPCIIILAALMKLSHRQCILSVLHADRNDHKEIDSHEIASLS